MDEKKLICLHVFLKHGTIVESYQFTADVLSATSYIFMKKKLETFFPNLRHSIYKITWRDNNGIEIMIASDQDFIIAFDAIKSKVKMLYITVIRPNTDPVFIPEGNMQGTQRQVLCVICDNCKQSFPRLHLKCFICPEFNLCVNCGYQGHHFKHYMMRVPSNDISMSEYEAEPLHHVAQNFEKSIAATAEARDTPEFAHKLEMQEHCNTEIEQPRNKAEPGCSTQQSESFLWPFIDDSINRDDIHAVGASSEQHSDPVLKYIRNVPQPKPNTDNQELHVNITPTAVNEDPMVTIEAHMQGTQQQASCIICDVCKQLLTGIYYKCFPCPKYYLCVNCEYQGHHYKHYMIRVPIDVFYVPKYQVEPLHHFSRNFEKLSTIALTKAQYAVESANTVETQEKCVSQIEQPKSETKLGSSSQQTKDPLLPPTKTTINLGNVHGLGALAREHSGLKVKTITNVPQPQESNTVNNELFMNTIRKGLDEFFGNPKNKENRFKADELQSIQVTTVDKENSLKGIALDVEGTAIQGACSHSQKDDKCDSVWSFITNELQHIVVSNEGTKHSTPVEAFSCENHSIQEGLLLLHEMGFSNEDGLLIRLLERFHGNVSLVIKALFENP